MTHAERRRQLEARITRDEAELRAAIRNLKRAGVQSLLPDNPLLREPALRVAGAFALGLWLGLRGARGG